ncbi:MAG: transposase [Planctomycetes bacterium]|nr:transposase [Planctomycetota bacterium]
MKKELFQDKYRVKQNRWDDWDYSWDGFYFVTICTRNKKEYFGKIIDGKMQLTEIGKIAEKYLLEISGHFECAKLDYYVIMPDHVHVIIIIKNTVETRDRVSLQKPVRNKFSRPVSGSMPVIINQYKSSVKRWCNKNGYPDFDWQPRYYDRVLRDDYELYFAQEYIAYNPSKSL